MKTILFSIEKFLDPAHPEWGPATSDYGVVGCLASLNMGLAAVFHYDEFLRKTPEENVNEALVRRVEGSKPDMVLATWLIQNGERNVKPETYGYIRDEMKVPVAMLWYESAPDVVRHADLLAPYVNINIFTDTRDEWRKHARHSEKCVHLLDPRDASLFNSPADAARDIPLSFVGTTFRRMDRAMNLAMLWGNGLRYYQCGGLDGIGAFLGTADYVRVLQRSLVTINFTSAVTFRHINARIAEATMCGAMLLQSEDFETPNILDPYSEYVPFKESFSLTGPGQVAYQAGDLVEKALHYAYTAQGEARRIAAAGHAKAVEKFDGREFWGSLFKLVGLA